MPITAAPRMAWRARMVRLERLITGEEPELRFRSKPMAVIGGGFSMC